MVVLVRVLIICKIPILAVVVEVIQELELVVAELVGGGGDHAAGGGGYSGGAGQAEPGGAENGKTAVGSSGSFPRYGTGGAYFERGTTSTTTYQEDYTKYAFFGGQGGQSAMHNSQGGDGGVAGKGGTIKVASNSKVYAYNGNKYTDNVAGHEYNEGKNQLEIYAQNGVLRAIYKYDIYFNMIEKRKISFFKEIFGSTVSNLIDTYTACSALRGVIHKNYLVRPETTCAKSGYINPSTNSIYGIGSGAGYIELSNGTYIIDGNMN